MVEIHDFDTTGKNAGHKMGWGKKPALLMVDVCSAYWTDGSPNDLRANPAANDVPHSMRKLVSAARASGVPIIWSTVKFHQDDMADAGLFYLKHRHLVIWKEGATEGFDQWVEGLVPEKNEIVIAKQYPSVFFSTSLSTTLHVLGVDTVVISGVSTSGCVRATALDAMCYGFRPMVVGAACGDKSPAVHNANLYDLNKKYADVVTEAEAIEHLSVKWN